jgi:hypothetical protein
MFKIMIVRIDDDTIDNTFYAATQRQAEKKEKQLLKSLQKNIFYVVVEKRET